MFPTVLIIDDDPTIREVLSGGLSEQGFDVMQLADATRSVTTITERQPDVVILDVMMPGMDGFEVCRAIRQTAATSQTAVIFLTARSAPADIERGLQLGADDYLTKPFDIFQLGDRLYTLIRERHPEPVVVPEVNPKPRRPNMAAKKAKKGGKKKSSKKSAKKKR